MKILKRNYEHRNLIIFLALSLVYLQSVSSLSHGVELFSIESMRSFFLEHYLIVVLTILTSFMVITVKKFSEVLLFFCLITIVGKSFILLSGSFNKLILIFNFVYILFAFYYFIVWELEVSLACFNPNFSKYDLVKEERFKLIAKIKFKDNHVFDAHVSNIDNQSCFLLLPKGFSLPPDSSECSLIVNYDNVQFEHNAMIVSQYNRGIGLVFMNSNTRFNWSELYKVCLERGIVS